MANFDRSNPIDEICRQLSVAQWLGDGSAPDLQQKYTDIELDGLYEFAKILFAVTQQKLALAKSSERLLEAVGLRVKFPSLSSSDIGDGPHIFVANHPGNCLIDAAIATRLIARLGPKPCVVTTNQMHLGLGAEDYIRVDHPRFGNLDPRNNAQIALNNARSILQMRSKLAQGNGLLLFPGAGLYDPLDAGPQLIDHSFDRLAPLLLACRDLKPRVHLFHIDYELPAWWIKLHDEDRVQFHVKQWKAVLSLNQQTARIRHLQSMSVHPAITKQQRFDLCNILHDRIVEKSILLNRKRELLAA